MGLSKSKPIRPNPSGFQPGAQGFPGQPGFHSQPVYQPGFPGQQVMEAVIHIHNQLQVSLHRFFQTTKALHVIQFHMLIKV